MSVARLALSREHHNGRFVSALPHPAQRRMTKTNMQRQDTRYAALLLAPAILMLLVPKVSAAEYTASDATKFVFTDSGIAVAEGN